MDENEIPSLEGLWISTEMYRHSVLKKLDSAEKIVYQLIVFRANDYKCWMSNKDLASSLLLNIKFLESTIKRLSDKRVIKIGRSRNDRRFIECVYKTKIGR